MRYSSYPGAGLVLLASGLALAACGSAPKPNAQLNQARDAYATASANPQVARFGAAELQDSQESLQTAQSAWSKNEDPTKVDHYAYLATQHAAIADQTTRRRMAEAQIANTARITTLNEVLFQTGKADLNPQAQRPITEIAVFLKNHPDRKVAITGYTDSTGSPQVNQKLSAERASAVQQALVRDGIDPSRISMQGAGESNPVASNATSQGRQQNRRVEVAISGGTGTEGMGTTEMGAPGMAPPGTGTTGTTGGR